MREPANSEPSFGDLLLNFRRAAGLTQDELAERSMLSARAISDLERGVKHVPRKDTVRLLAQALGLGPADRALFEEKARRRLPGADAFAAPPAAPLPLPHNNLPARALSLIGRAADLASLRAILSPRRTRLVTLTGTAGIGKTELALELATQVAPEFGDGVYYVDLAAVADPQLVAVAIATVLGLAGEMGRTPTDTLKAYLAPRRVMLVLDNFEHLLAAGGLLVALLGAAPGLVLVVTSRAALRLQQEQEFAVMPLALPDLQNLPGPARLAAVAAVELFVSRAQQVKFDFALDAENATTVATICVRLDGLPLALELAAARVRILPPAAILQRLTSSLSLLTGGSPRLPARQQTLRAALDWSYALLGAGEKALLARLATCAGGASLEVIAALCEAAPALHGDTLAGLDSLAAQSLLRACVVATPHGAVPRFVLLETIREYALERLSASPAVLAACRAAHGRYFLNLLAAQAASLVELQAAGTLAELDIEIDNIRAAWQWAVMHGQHDAIAAAMDGLERLYDLHGWYGEGGELFQSAVAMVRQAGDGELLGALLARQALFAARQGQLMQARALLEESRTAMPAERAPALAYVLDRLGAIMAQQGHFDAAQDFHQESLAIAERTGDRKAAMNALNTLGLDASKLGQFDQAQDYFAASLALAQALGDQRMIARTLNYVAYCHALAGEPAVAATKLEQSLALAQQLGDKGLLPYIAGSMGEAALAARDLSGARRYSEASLAGAEQLGDRMLQAYAQLRLGTIAWAEGDTAAAGAAWRAGLETALLIAAVPRALDALVGLGLVLARRGEREEALQLLQAVLAHPALEAVSRERARAALDAIGGPGATPAAATQLVALIEIILGRPLPQAQAAALGAF